MILHHLDLGSCLFASDVRLQGNPQERKRPVSFDAAQARLDVEERRVQPALLLIRGTPGSDLGGPPPDERQDGLEAVPHLTFTKQVL